MLDADITEVCLDLRPGDDPADVMAELERYGMIVIDEGEHRERAAPASDMRFERKVTGWIRTDSYTGPEPQTQYGPFTEIPVCKIGDAAAVAYMTGDEFNGWLFAFAKGERIGETVGAWEDHLKSTLAAMAATAPNDPLIYAMVMTAVAEAFGGRQISARDAEAVKLAGEAKVLASIGDHTGATALLRKQKSRLRRQRL